MKKHFGDLQDSNFFGNLFLLAGSFLLSLVILDGIKFFIKEIYWFNYFIVICMGYLIYSLGFFISNRNKVETIWVIKNFLVVLALMIILCFLIIF
jgi:hypothetical protein